jgi:conjugal transfer pilus assembly protein TraV
MRYAAILTGVLALTGCAIGKSEFTCSGIPEGVSCLSASEVYEASKRTDGPVTGNPEKRDQQEQQGPASAAPKSLPGMVPEIADGALPLRTPSRVMRIWVAPWEAEDSDLHLTKLIYTEIEPRRWTIGKTARTRAREITPLQSGPTGPTMQPVAPPATRPSGAKSTTASSPAAATNVPAASGTKPAATSGTPTR